MEDRRQEIKQTLGNIEFGVISTLEEGNIKSRAMHFAVDDQFNFYLASIKGDPKIKQLISQPAISLLLLYGNQGFPQAKEIEVAGTGEILRSEDERAAAFARLESRSPVVANMKQGGALGMLEVIRVTPTFLKYRVVEEIMRGVGPTVLEFAPAKKNWLTEKINSWAIELRLPFLTATLVPVILGTLIAWQKTGGFDLGLFGLTLVGAALLHEGTNVANDYFDHKSGNDEANKEFIRPFSGGSRMIQKGKLSANEVLGGALLCFALASLIGLYLISVRGPFILVLGLIGLFSGFFYSAPPLNLVGRGVGELLVGLNFGTLMTLGAFFVQTQTISWEPVVASLPIAFLIAAVLYINEFPDYEADKSVGKDHWVVRLGKEKAVIGYAVIMWAVYASIVLGVVFRLISPFTLLGLLTLPRALRAMRVARLNYNNTLFLIPANADTVLVHLTTGVLLGAGYLLHKILLG